MFIGMKLSVGLPPYMSTKIVVRLAGGLGNQLFQFAAALRACTELNLKTESIIIDVRFLDCYESKHHFELDFLKDVFPGFQVAPPLSLVQSIASKFRLAKIFNRKIWSHAFISTPEQILLLNSKAKIDLIVLDGYFQSLCILLSDIQRKLLQRHLVDAGVCQYKKLVGDGTAIAMHIRRGDYVTSKEASRVFRTIPIDYYRTALSRLPKNRKILVFSDDASLSAEFAKEFSGIDIRSYNLSLADEFRLFMSCDDYIIANSTFSWWAAYLGYSENKSCFAPKRWYVDPVRSETNSLLLPYFQLIDY
jgi:hypothetical protein